MKNTFKFLQNRYTVLLHDFVMIFVGWFLAYFLRFNLHVIPRVLFIPALYTLSLLVVIQTISYWVFGLYRGIWRFASVPDLIRIVKSLLLATITTILILFFMGYLKYIPRSIFPLYFLLMVVLLGGPRLLYRYVRERFRFSFAGKRVLIVGAGVAGEGIIRELYRNNKFYKPVVVVDDDFKKQGIELQGVRVVGSCEQIPQIAKKHAIDLIFIAIPSASARDMRRMVSLCESAEVEFRTLPNLHDLVDGRVSMKALREVSIEDLLGREQVDVDWTEIKEKISGKKILITGGAGSIGSELCRQVAQLSPAQLIILDHSEHNIYQLTRELQEHFPKLNYQICLGSVVDERFVKCVMKNSEPDIIFHAAAYKHVPILEEQVFSAFYNNVLGTKIVSEAAIEHNVKQFVLISTDKAVLPSNVMGASKRITEILCHAHNENCVTNFMVVRFGNVLGSSGSVIPLFKEQVKRGGPVTVTHAEATRYFMTIREAVQLILQASVFGERGKIFVLDMGEPVKINYLAEQLIRLSGLEPNVDIDIVYVGLRPGEKIHEELFYANEPSGLTRHEKIFETRLSDNLDPSFSGVLEKLYKALTSMDQELVLNMVSSIMKEMQQ